ERGGLARCQGRARRPFGERPAGPSAPPRRVRPGADRPRRDRVPGGARKARRERLARARRITLPDQLSPAGAGARNARSPIERIGGTLEGGQIGPLLVRTARFAL